MRDVRHPIDSSVTLMETDKIILELERVLGLSFSHELLLSGKKFRYARLDPEDPEEESLYRAMEVLEKRCVDWANDCTTFLGAKGEEPYAVYVGPKISPLEILEPFGVGTHNDDGNQHEQTIWMLSELFQAVPFVAYFADAAGYRVRFLSDVTDALAKRIEEQVLEVCPDAIELHEGDVAETIVQQRRLILWWD